MHKFQDPTRRANIAIFGLCLYIVFKGLRAISRFFILPGDPPSPTIFFAYMGALIFSYIAVGCWLYRANANAHALGGDMAISPGWQIGWFFVPLANLIMPYQGLQETWEASHRAAGQPDAPRTPLLGWWWGLWLADNIVTNVGQFMASEPTFARNGSYQVNLAAWLVGTAASLVLIQLMRRLNRAQLTASRSDVFA